MRHAVRRFTIASVLAGLVVLAASMPTFAASSGNVVGQVVAQAPLEACLTVSTNAVDFGSGEFSTAGSDTVLTAPTTPYTLTSCSDGIQAFLGRATNADSTTTAATWAPEDPLEANTIGDPVCDSGPDVFRLSAQIGTSGTFLDLSDEALSGAGRNGTDEVGAGGTRDITNSLTLPCDGSAGQGETMQMTMTYTAVLTGSN